MRISQITSSLILLPACVLISPTGVSARPPVCTLNEVQKLIASDAAEQARFGSALAMTKDRAIVGAWRAGWPDSATGAAYVFRLDDNGTPLDPTDDFWFEEAKLSGSGGLFGWSVSISGKRAVVGARRDTLPPWGGAAYSYRLDDSGTPSDPDDDVWVEEDKLTASDAATGDEFGIAVAIDVDRIAVGASEDDDACDEFPDPDCDSGAVYVFRRDDQDTPLDPSDDVWVEEDKLTASDAAQGDMFGFTVSMHGARILVGAWHDDDAGIDSGSAYVFKLDDNGTPSDPSDDWWAEEDKLAPSDAETGDEFGFSVSIHRDHAIVGSWLDDDAGNLSGSAYIFRRDDNGTESYPGDDLWVEQDKITASDAAPGDEFGKSVSISGDWAAVGVYEDDDACVDDPHCDSGSAYVFRRDDNDTRWDPSDDSWVQAAKLTASDTAAQDFFGRVAINGGHLIAGSLDDAAGEFAGSAYMFLVTRECTDLLTFADLQCCLTGDGGGVFPDCEVFDADRDGDVDLEDYEWFRQTFVGP